MFFKKEKDWENRFTYVGLVDTCKKIQEKLKEQEAKRELDDIKWRITRLSEKYSDGGCVREITGIIRDIVNNANK